MLFLTLLSLLDSYILYIWPLKRSQNHLNGRADSWWNSSHGSKLLRDVLKAVRITARDSSPWSRTECYSRRRTASLCPVSLKGKLKEELDGLQQLKIISPIREPNPWVGSLAVAVTKSGAPRICNNPRAPKTALKKGINLRYKRTCSRNSQKRQYPWRLTSSWDTGTLSSPLNLTYSRRMQPPMEGTDGFVCLSVSLPYQRYFRSSSTSKPVWFFLHPGRHPRLWYWRDRWRNNRKPWRESSRSPSKVITDTSWSWAWVK